MSKADLEHGHVRSGSVFLRLWARSKTRKILQGGTTLPLATLCSRVSRYCIYSQYTDLMDRFQAEGCLWLSSVRYGLAQDSDSLPLEWLDSRWNQDVPDQLPSYMVFMSVAKVTLSISRWHSFEDAYPMVAKRLGLDAEKEEAAALTLRSTFRGLFRRCPSSLEIKSRLLV